MEADILALASLVSSRAKLKSAARHRQLRARKWKRACPLCDRCDRPGVHHIFLQDRIACVDFRERHVISPEIGQVLEDVSSVRLLQLSSSHDNMLQHEA